MLEMILSSFPEYIRVKDLPHDDTNYKVYTVFDNLFCVDKCVSVCRLFRHRSFFRGGGGWGIFCRGGEG